MINDHHPNRELVARSVSTVRFASSDMKPKLHTLQIW